MTATNIVYRTDAIANYFANNRMRWDQFYPSERWVLERIGNIRRVLDVGCAAGGLGLALQERFPLKQYVGVEINDQVVAIARERQTLFQCPASLHLGDILKMSTIDGGPFDLVANLSCSDWNIQTREITDACWRHVAPGGSLLISLRLTNATGINDFSKSYQFIRYDGEVSDADERANYVVFNVQDALALFQGMLPRASKVVGYGYWGRPSKTAITPYEQLVFAVFAVTKATSETDSTTCELHLPLSLLARV